MRACTDWFRDARWGVFVHYLAGVASARRGTTEMPIDEWNRRIDGFDVDTLAGQLADVGAGYFFLTLGQNSGYYLSPNATYDEYVGRQPSRLSRRDLVADLIAALTPHGIRMMVYLPSHAPAYDPQAVVGLQCTPSWDASAWQLKPGTYLAEDEVDTRLSEFQRRWEAVIREWSLRWGRGVSGWWFDGCYHADKMYRHPDEPNFASFAAAAKAGNPDSLVAFNPGVKVPVICYSEHEDYTAGEVADAFPMPFRHRPLGRLVRWRAAPPAHVPGRILGARRAAFPRRTGRRLHQHGERAGRRTLLGRADASRRHHPRGVPAATHAAAVTGGLSSCSCTP